MLDYLNEKNRALLLPGDVSTSENRKLLVLSVEQMLFAWIVLISNGLFLLLQHKTITFSTVKLIDSS